MPANLPPNSGGESFDEKSTEREIFEQHAEQIDLLPHDADFGQFSASNRTSYGLETNDPSSPGYWRMVADWAQQKASESTDNDSFESLVETLTLSTPDGLYTQHALNRGRDSYGPMNGEGSEEAWAAYDEDRARSSRYVSILERVISAKPNLGHSALTTHLEEVADISITDEYMLPECDEAIRAMLRGVRHQLAAEQVLQHLKKHEGRDYRRATPEEDLHGLDFVVAGANEWLGVDVKASAFTFQDEATDGQPFALRGGHILLFSRLKDSFFGDGFFIPDDIVRKLAPFVRSSLNEAERQLLKQRQRDLG